MQSPECSNCRAQAEILAKTQEVLASRNAIIAENEAMLSELTEHLNEKDVRIKQFEMDLLSGTPKGTPAGPENRSQFYLCVISRILNLPIESIIAMKDEELESLSEENRTKAIKPKDSVEETQNVISQPIPLEECKENNESSIAKDESSQIKILKENFENLLQIKQSAENENRQLHIENELLKKKFEGIKESNQEKIVEIEHLREMIVVHKAREQLFEQECEEYKKKVTLLKDIEFELSAKIEKFTAIEKAVSDIYFRIPSSNEKNSEVSSLNKLAEINVWIESISKREIPNSEIESDADLIKKYHYLLMLLVDDAKALRDFKFLEELFNNLKDLAIVNKKLEADNIELYDEKNAQRERINQLTENIQSLSAELEKVPQEIARMQRALEEKTAIIEQYERDIEALKIDIQTLRKQTQLIREYEMHAAKLESQQDRALLKELTLKTVSAKLFTEFQNEDESAPAETKEVEKQLKEYEELFDAVKGAIRDSDSPIRCLKALGVLLNDQNIADHLLSVEKDTDSPEGLSAQEAKIKELESEIHSLKNQLQALEALKRERNSANKKPSMSQEPEAPIQKSDESKVETSSGGDLASKGSFAKDNQSIRQELFKKDQIIANLKGQLNYLKAIVNMIVDIKQVIYNASADEEGISWKIQKLKYLIDDFENTQAKLDEKTITSILARFNSKHQTISEDSAIRDELTKSTKLLGEIKEIVFNESASKNALRSLRGVRALFDEEQSEMEEDEEKFKGPAISSVHSEPISKEEQNQLQEAKNRTNSHAKAENLQLAEENQTVEEEKVKEPRLEPDSSKPPKTEDIKKDDRDVIIMGLHQRISYLEEALHRLEKQNSSQDPEYSELMREIHHLQQINNDIYSEVARRESIENSAPQVHSLARISSILLKPDLSRKDIETLINFVQSNEIENENSRSQIKVPQQERKILVQTLVDLLKAATTYRVELIMSVLRKVDIVQRDAVKLSRQNSQEAGEKDLDTFLILLLNTTKHIEAHLKILSFKEDQTTSQILSLTKVSDEREVEDTVFSVEKGLQRELALNLQQDKSPNDESQYLLQSNSTLQKMLSPRISSEFEIEIRHETPEKDILSSNGRRAGTYKSQEEQPTSIQRWIKQGFQNSPELSTKFSGKHSLKRRPTLDDGLFDNSTQEDVSREKKIHLQTQVPLSTSANSPSPTTFQINQYYFPSIVNAVEYQNQYVQKLPSAYSIQPQSARARFQGTVGFRSTNNPRDEASSFDERLDNIRKEITKIELSQKMSKTPRATEGQKTSFDNSASKPDNLINSLKALKGFAKGISDCNESILENLHGSRERRSSHQTSFRADNMGQLPINSGNKIHSRDLASKSNC